MKTFITFVSVIIALLPVWISWGIIHAAHPTTFWEGLAAIGLAIYLLGAVQVVLLVALVVWMFILWGS